MKYIAHRGLYNGPSKTYENSIMQISMARRNGFEVEVDTWWDGESWSTGHDGPVHDCTWEFLNVAGTWLHCKSLMTFHKLQEIKHQLSNLQADFFWHESDQVVLTASGTVWTNYGKLETLSPYSICVMPEANYSRTQIVKLTDIAGFCSDYISDIRNMMEPNTILLYPN
jgi:hypothetical protein